MKAAVFYECGGPENIQIVDLPDPIFKPNEVLIQIEAAALNHHDLWMLRGPADSSYQFPYCGGSDIAGIIVETGDQVSTVKVGERVLVNPNISCGLCEACQAGEHSLCPDYDILIGGFAELIAIPEDRVLGIPDDLSFTDAAAVPLVFQTAWRALITQGQMRPGEVVLVLGASGGAASAAVQIAHLAGARVIAVTSSPDKMEKARGLGADYVLNRKEGDYWPEIRTITNNRGVDLVVESIGATTWKQSMRSLAKGGRLVSFGRTTGRIGETNISLLFWNQLHIIGSTMSNDREFLDVMNLIFRGKLIPVVDSVFSLDEAQAAFAHLSAGKQFGKVVIQMIDY